MSRNKYIKIAIPYSKINSILQSHNFQNIIFHIDLQSISKGLYQKNNIFFEIDYYITNKKPATSLIDEYKDLLNTLYKSYKRYNPFFVSFYDDGINQQNTTISSSYKNGRSVHSDFLQDDETELFKKIKINYFLEIEKYFEKPNLSKVYYLKNYEADFIPHYVIMNNLFNSQSSSTLNIIFSNDKDLLQTCKFTNTIQITNRFFSSKLGQKQLGIDVYNDSTAIQYIYKNFKVGQLTAKHIPLLLALMGDKADGIPGLKGIGAAKAIKLIQNYNLPSELCELKKCKEPKILMDNFKLIIQNYQLTSFEEQLNRSKSILN